MTKAPACITVDFETEAIEDRPGYPPVPVGVSIRWPGKRPKYWAWGHPTENNCGKAEGYREVKKAWADPRPKLFHNCKFDMEVAEVHIGVKPLPWELVHDTMFVIYLHDPHSPDLKLKPAAERILGEPPEEQDQVYAWIMEHKAALIAKYGGKINKSTIGGWICRAPGALVGKYANGDTMRTWGIFNKLYPTICDRGMVPAYDREREIARVFLQNERDGICVDLQGLRRDIPVYQAAKAKADAWLCKRLKRPDMNVDSNEEFAEALAQCKIVKDEDWTLTATGKRSTSKDNLRENMFQDAKVARVYGYRNRLGTCLSMFMESWLRQAEINDGHITTHWNQVRQPGGGTRTGRPSTNNHNFLNISKTWDDKEDGYVHPAFLELPALPLTRRYILPDKGGLFCHRDYNQQELRILAHFEEGALMEAYLRDLRVDVHNFVRDLILKITGQEWPRRPVKIVNFRTIYGGGAPATAAGVGCSMAEAKQLLYAHGAALPGIKELKAAIKDLTASGEPITTWGGREYYVEPPGFSKKYNRWMDYYYKLLNYLVQGSAADATKQALLNYHNHPGKRGRFLVTVYDEINVSSAPEKIAKLRRLAAEHEMRVLRESMECLEFDVPLLSDGKTGPNWADVKKFAEPPSKWELAS